MSRVTWRGDAVRAKVLRATEAAVNDVTEKAAEAAKGSHSWHSRSGQLEGEIENAPAERRGREIVGKFGSTQGRGFYGLFLERRTPFLRPAADQVFTTLASKIKRRL